MGTQHIHAHVRRHATRGLAAALLASSRSGAGLLLEHSTLESPM